MATIGDRIKEAREAAGMKQEALAHAAGVTKQAVSAMETGGTKNPKPLHLLAISDATGYSLRWLITGKGPKIITREAAEDMLDITALTPDSKAAIRAVLHSLAQQTSPPKTNHS